LFCFVLVEKENKETTTTGKQNFSVLYLNYINSIEENDQRLTSAQSINKKKDRVKRSKKRSKKSSSICEGDSVSNDNTSYSFQLENKLKWAVDEV
jgi:hypothetical protein